MERETKDTNRPPVSIRWLNEPGVGPLAKIERQGAGLAAGSLIRD